MEPRFDATPCPKRRLPAELVLERTLQVNRSGFMPEDETLLARGEDSCRLERNPQR